MIKEKKGIVVIREGTVEEIVTCDVCGAQIDHYIDVTTGHYDWGNESSESREHHECCSWDCALKFMENWKNQKDVQRSKTAYIEFEQYNAEKRTDNSYEEYLKLKAFYDKKDLEF